MEAAWDTFTLIPKTISWKESTSGYPLDAWYQEDISEKVNSIVKLFDVNMVIVNYLMQSKLLESLPSGVHKVIDTHDIFGERAQYIHEHISENYTWYSISKEDEKRGLERADTILAIQEKEAKYFASLTSKPIKVINHIEEERFLNRHYTQLKKIGFIGTKAQPNTTSLNAFLELFLASELSKKNQIIIAGAASDTIKFKHESIVCMGKVENLQTFYDAVDLVINPLTFGTGLKIKSVEALSFGVPIVSTDIGFDGLQSTESCHTLQSHQQMIECIEELDKSPQKLQKLANLSRELFTSYEANVNKEMESIFGNGDNKNLNKEEMQILLAKKEKSVQSLHGDLQSKANEVSVLQKMIETIKKWFHTGNHN